MPDNLPKFEVYAVAIRKLLKGVVYHDDPAWMQIRDYEFPIREYLAKIGLGIHLDEIGNFAYLYDQSRDDDQPSSLPALTNRRNLSFPDTLLLVLLRERLDEHEMRDLDGNRLILSIDEITEMYRVFVDNTADARRTDQSLLNSMNRLKKYGFLTERHDKRFEVRPLLRAKISADELEEIKSRLQHYIQQNHVSELEDEDGESV
ncbi:MAG: DUF4194 domain-containing protein [Phototrophicales bacterium]|nr:DUF4194 domain-containing protein [Phototrophicales bacterium]